jgi:hypothetical protein
MLRRRGSLLKQSMSAPAGRRVAVNAALHGGDHMATRRSSDLPQSAEIPPIGQVSAGTHGDNLRAHFMNALLRDPRVAALFDAWGKRTGLYSGADAVALEVRRQLEALPGVGIEPDGGRGIVVHFDEALTESVTAVLGTRCRAGSAFPADEFPTAVAIGPSLLPHAQGFIERFTRVREAFFASPETVAGPFVLDTLKLSWGWLAYELVDSFFRHVQARAFGVGVTRSFTVVAQSSPVPRLAWHASFETHEGETVTAARARLLSTAADAWRACGDALRAMEHAERKALGRRPNKDTRYLQQWAEWFYRADVKQPADTVSALVRESSPDQQKMLAHNLPRRRVQLGIAKAKQLLSQGVYEIHEQPPPRKLARRKTAR